MKDHVYDTIGHAQICNIYFYLPSPGEKSGTPSAHAGSRTSPAAGIIDVGKGHTSVVATAALHLGQKAAAQAASPAGRSASRAGARVRSSSRRSPLRRLRFTWVFRQAGHATPCNGHGGSHVRKSLSFGAAAGQFVGRASRSRKQARGTEGRGGYISIHIHSTAPGGRGTGGGLLGRPDSRSGRGSRRGNRIRIF